MSLCSINLLVFITDMKRIYSAVRVESLNIMQVKVLITRFQDAFQKSEMATHMTPLYPVLLSRDEHPKSYN
jgi:hypothetical protein